MPQPVIAAFRTANGTPSLVRYSPASAIVLSDHAGTETDPTVRLPVPLRAAGESSDPCR
jgi:hypothetical protein